MKILLLLLALLWSVPAGAEGLHLLELDRFSFESAKIVNHNDPYYGYSDPNGATDEHWEYYTAAKFNLDLISYSGVGLYVNNTVDAASTDHQYRTTSWAWEAGANFQDRAQFFWNHHSAHVLDTARPDEHFILDNWYGVRVVLYKRGDK